MATEVLYNYDPLTPAQITREEYEDVGSSKFQLGEAARGFQGSTDFEVWDSVSGGTQLTEDVDYDILDIDDRLSPDAGFDIYTRLQILNPTYQTGSIFITYKVVLSYVDAAFYNNLYDLVIDAAIGKTKYLTTADSPFTVLDGDGFSQLICDTSGGDLDINWPTLADNQNRSIEVIHQVGGNLVSVFGEGAETIDGFTTIELPLKNDRLTGLGTTSEWAITEERISSQLTVYTYAGYGSVDTNIMRFATTYTAYGNIFSENHTSGYNSNTEGLEITANRSGRYAFSWSVQSQLAGDLAFVFSYNSANLNTAPASLPSTELFNYSTSSNGIPQNGMWTGFLNKGDVVRAHTSGGIPDTAKYDFFTVTYLGG